MYANKKDKNMRIQSITSNLINRNYYSAHIQTNHKKINNQNVSFSSVNIENPKTFDDWVAYFEFHKDDPKYKKTAEEIKAEEERDAELAEYERKEDEDDDAYYRYHTQDLPPYFPEDLCGP